MANEEHLEILKQGVEAWNKWRKENPDVEPDLDGATLTKANLSKANLSGADLNGADLSGANLLRANLLEGHLWSTNLTRVSLLEANLTKADLRKADLSGANLNGANLNGANLWAANLTKADLRKANLSGADLNGADLSGADLWEADLRRANLSGANLDNANVEGAGIDRQTQCRGIRAATCYGSPRFKRMAQDNDFLEELRSTERGEILYTLWSAFADCGRTPWRWIAWSLFLAAFFALVFCWLGPEAFKVDQLPHATFGETYFTMLYYSVVTFTTLGFGDITPNTPQAARWVMAEVISGYVMLGGLISILANILARRS